MSEVNRPGLLTGADVSELNAAAQALPNLPTPFSAEFLEYRRCLQLHIDAYDVPEPEFGTPEFKTWDAATRAAGEVRHQACLLIRDRPVRSRQDLAELALVVRQELWQIEPDGSWHAHSTNEELHDALIRAVFAMIEGGINGRPETSLTSPRAERLRALCVELENLPEDHTDEDVNRLVDEVYAISDDIMAAPAPGLVGLIEHAMAVHYWFRPKGCSSGPGGDIECVQALVAAVVAMAEGGAHG